MSTNDSPNLYDKIKANREIISKYEMLIAAGEGNVKKMKRYLENNKNLKDCKDQYGNTVLHYAVEGNKINIVKLLLQNENVSDIITRENNNEETPFDIGLRMHLEEICDLLGDVIVKNTNVSLPQELKNIMLTMQSAIKDTKSEFIQETFSRNYEVPLSEKDIKDILLLKYPKRSEIFKICKLQDLHLRDKLLECRFSNEEDTPRFIFIIDAGNLCWFTLSINYIKKCQLYDIVYVRISNNVSKKLKNTLQNLNIATTTVKNLKYADNSKKNDFGIYCIEDAETINHCFQNNDVHNIFCCLNNNPYDTSETREFYANILNEKRRTEEKIKYCLEILNKLNKNMVDVNLTEFSYEEANVFILFLETFSLEDTYIKSSNAEKAKKLMNDVRDMKKTYFKNYIPKESFDLITSARNKILHNNKTLKPSDFSHFMSTSNKKDFFRNMEKFTEIVHKNVNNPHDKFITSISCAEFLEPLKKQNEIGKESNLFEVFSSFLKDIYNPCFKRKSEKWEKVLFDLTVNILPVLENRKEKVKSLSAIRNELIHNFQNFSSSEERLEKLQELTFLKSNLYKYYYSGKIHDILKGLKGNDTSDTIDSRFSESLKDSEIDFLQDRNIVASETEANTNWEYIFQGSLFPKKKEDVQELVNQYLKYMVIVDYTESEDFVDNYKALYNYKKINDVERREVFEDFLKLKQLSKNTKNEIQWRRMKNTLKNKLVCDYGVRKELYNKIIDIYITEDKDILNVNKEILRDITMVLLTIKNIMDQNPQLSDFDIIAIYQHYCKTKTVFKLEECVDLPPCKYKRSKFYIEVGINSLCRIGNRKFSITETDYIEINAEQIINNMLKTFYGTYHKYQIKFCNIEAAFCDETFLNYLVDKDIDNKIQIKNPDRIVWLIKKLLKIDYTAPYIATLISKRQDFDLIEQDDLMTLTDLLLNNQSHKEFLIALLDVKDDHIRFILYQKISEWLLGNNSKIETLRVLIKKPEHIKGILRCLDENLSDMDEKKSEKLIQILKLLISILRESFYDHDYQDMLDVLKCDEVTILVNKVFKQDLNLEIKYLIAKIKKEMNKYHEAISILENELKKFSSTSEFREHYMLILEELAYIYKLQKKYNKSATRYEELYLTVIKYVLGYEIKCLSIDSIRDIYMQMQNSEKYQKLLVAFEEYGSAKHFEVLGILDNFAYTKQRSKSTLNNFMNVLIIAKNIYNCGKNNLNINNKNSVPIHAILQIASLYYAIGKMQEKKSLHYFYNALLWELKLLRLQKQKHGDRHPITVTRVLCIVRNLISIASIYNMKENYDKVISTTLSLTTFKNYNYEHTNHQHILEAKSTKSAEKLMEALKIGGKMYEEAIIKQIDLYKRLKVAGKNKKLQKKHAKKKTTSPHVPVSVIKRKWRKRKS